MSIDRLEQVEATGVRTRDAILSGIRKLLKLQKKVPVTNLDGEDNLAAIDAQIDTLMDDTAEEDLALHYDGEPYLLRCATEARHWLDGKLLDVDDEAIGLADSWLADLEGEEA